MSPRKSFLVWISVLLMAIATERIAWTFGGVILVLCNLTVTLTAYRLGKQEGLKDE